VTYFRRQERVALSALLGSCGQFGGKTVVHEKDRPVCGQRVVFPFWGLDFGVCEGEVRDCGYSKKGGAELAFI